MGLVRVLEEADRRHHALAGLDQEVAAEARQLADAGHEPFPDLLRQLLGAGLVDSLVPSHGGIHVLLLTLLLQERKALLSPPSAFRPGKTVEKEKKGAFAASALDLRALEE